MNRSNSSAVNSRMSSSLPEPVTLPALWAWLAFVVAVLAAAASVVGLLVADRIYGKETVMLADAATAQDIVTLLVVVPLLGLMSLRARRGSLVAVLCVPGILAFTTYNYAIYAFSIHFGPLFLVWIAVLGLSIFALVGGLATADISTIKRRFAGRTMTFTAVFLIAVAGLFALLWLSEIVPDMLAGKPSHSANDWKIPTNPVHVLDLAFFLPAVITTGVLLRRRHPLGYATVPGQLVWLALTCLPILITPLVAAGRGHNAGWSVTIPIGVFLVTILVVLIQLLHRLTVNPKTSAEAAR
ncbi:MAG: hypothetical protein ABI137_08580 [Antricoccus sp.]